MTTSRRRKRQNVVGVNIPNSDDHLLADNKTLRSELGHVLVAKATTPSRAGKNEAAKSVGLPERRSSCQSSQVPDMFTELPVAFNSRPKLAGFRTHLLALRDQGIARL
jgi:hypothetical protein